MTGFFFLGSENQLLTQVMNAFKINIIQKWDNADRHHLAAICLILKDSIS